MEHILNMTSFVPLTPTPNTSFGNRVAMDQSITSMLFSRLRMNPLFLLNLLGRPDYWAPQTQWELNKNGDFVGCGMFHSHTLLLEKLC
jgi:hypothetical protein